MNRHKDLKVTVRNFNELRDKFKDTLVRIKYVNGVSVVEELFEITTLKTQMPLNQETGNFDSQGTPVPVTRIASILKEEKYKLMAPFIRDVDPSNDYPKDIQEGGSAKDRLMRDQ